MRYEVLLVHEHVEKRNMKDPLNLSAKAGLAAGEIDVSRRGVQFTKKAFEQVDSNVHHVETSQYVIGHGKNPSPLGMFLRDGSVVCGVATPNFDWTYHAPYVFMI